MCNHHGHPSPELLSSCKRGTLHPLNGHSTPPLPPDPCPPPPATTTLPSVSTILTAPGPSHGWNPAVLVFLCPGYFPRYTVLQVHPCRARARISFPSEADDIPLYRCVTFCLSTYLSVAIWATSIVITTDNAAVDIGVRLSLWDPALNSFECTPSSGIAGPYGNCTWNFWRNHHTVFHSGCTISHSHQCFLCLFSPSVPNTASLKPFSISRKMNSSSIDGLWAGPPGV